MKSNWLPPRTKANRNPHDWWVETPVMYSFGLVQSPVLSFVLAILLTLFCLAGIVSGIVILSIGDNVGMGLGLLLPSAIVLLPLSIAGLYLTIRRLFWRP